MRSSKIELTSDSSATISDRSTTDGDESRYAIGQKVLAYHTERLYEAKVVKVEYRSRFKTWEYFVHYLGWNKNWDEWVREDRLVDYTDENKQKSQIATKHAFEGNTKAWCGSYTKPRSPRVARSRKRGRGSLTELPTSEELFDEESSEKDVVPLEKLANLLIPPTLKKQLVDDCLFITHLGKLVKLPRTPNVDDIMKKYLEYRSKKDGSISEAVGETTKGICCYFNKALWVMLLYKSEREQYTDAIKDDVSPSTVYGAEHLLRLFVKLPELLIYANIEVETLMQLQQVLADFLKFLQKNQCAFFLSTYHVLEDTETSTNRQDD